MDIIKKLSKTHHLWEQNYAAIWKKNPIREACFTENVLRYAKISRGDEKCNSKLYRGICETTFKKRYANHEKLLIRKKTRTIKYHLLNGGS